jgi:DNA-binding NtrC family response regulator
MGAVLLIDDDAATLQAYTALFAERDSSTKVLTAASAEEGIGFLQTIVFDVVVCDLQLPGMDGLGLLKKSQEIQPETPVVLVTGHGDRELEATAAEKGIYAVLHKPIDPVVLLSVVKRSTLRKRARRAPQLAALAATSEEACHDRIKAMNERFARVMDDLDDERSRPSH